MKYLVASVVVAALFAVRVEFLIHQENSETLPHFIGQTEVIVGRVAEDPDARDTATRVTLDNLSIDNTPVSGKLLALLSPNASVSYGDALQVRGKVSAPEAFETSNGHTFDYPSYLRVQGISAQMSYAKLLDSRPNGWSVLGTLYSIKHAFEHSLERLIPNPEGALLQGELLGEKHGISPTVMNAFIGSGLVHIVVLSGYNISIVALAIFWLLSPLPRRPRLAAGGAVMILFVLMTGAGAASVRALFMALIALLANYLQRPTMALRALVVAALAMALWNPLVVLFDPSFILSVLATFGLITLSPWVESYLFKIKLLRRDALASTRTILAATLAVELFVTPALLYFSGVFSLLSLPANVLVLPLIPATMLWGFVAGALGLILPYLGLIPAFVAYILLKCTLLVVAVVALIPHSSFTVAQFSPWWLLSVYVPLTWFAIAKFTAASNLRVHQSAPQPRSN